MTTEVEQIYRRHGQGMFLAALSILGRAEAAEDAVHDAVVRLCRDGPRPPKRDAVAYAFAAVRNAALDARRRGFRRRSADELPDVADDRPPVFVTVGDGERSRMVCDAVQGLPDDQREAVVLHLFAGLTFAQAAESVGAPLQTMASRYRRGLLALRESLARLNEVGHG